MINKLKSQTLNLKSTTQNLKSFLVAFFLFLLMLFLLINVYASQIISSVYFQLINNNRQATINFLKKINKQPQFAFFLKTNKNIFNRFLESEVFNEQRIKEEKIAELHSLLEKNSKSRDTLYNLYLLNKDLDNIQEAEKYFKLAKEIDPNIE